MNYDEIKYIGLHYRSGLYYSGIRQLDYFEILRTKEVNITSTFQEYMEAQFEYYYQICCPCVGPYENENLSGPQKDLLICH